MSDYLEPQQNSVLLHTPEDALDRSWTVVGSYVFYDTNGRVLLTAKMQRILCDDVAVNNGGLNWLEGDADLSLDYVAENTVQPRPQNPTALAGKTLSALPQPCTITINGTAYDCADPSADLSFDQPGTYKVVVSAWPYLDKEFNIENPA